MKRCYHRAALRALALTALVVLGLVAPAAAEPDTVAFLPLEADRKLSLYQGAAGTALAARVRAAGYNVAVVSDVAAIPSGAWLVVDGRLLRRGRGAALELRLRDPEAGRDVTRLSGAASTLAELDVAIDHLADELTAVLAREQAARTPPEPPPEPPPDAPPIVAPPAPPPDPRPIARLEVRGKALHDRGGAPIDATALVAAAFARLPHRLGYRVVDGAAAPALTISAEVVWLVAGFEGPVPVGRGRVRVIVRDPRGALFDRVVRTDTVVGSRGDRVDTIVRLVAAQAVDIALPRVRERLAARGPR